MNDVANITDGSKGPAVPNPRRRYRVAGGVGDQPLTARQERYAQALAQGVSYAQAWDMCGYTASTIGARSAHIHALAHHPGVRARAKELRKLADADPIADIADRMNMLRLIVEADPSELTRVEHLPCDLCWPDARIAEAYARHFTVNEFSDPAPLPDLKNPRIDCERCTGHGVKTVVITPTDQLSPAGRALFAGTKVDKNGNIVVVMHDKLAASDQLNKLQSAYVTKSLNINANMNVPVARDAEPADALALFDRFKS